LRTSTTSVPSTAKARARATRLSISSGDSRQSQVKLICGRRDGNDQEVREPGARFLQHAPGPVYNDGPSRSDALPNGSGYAIAKAISTPAQGVSACRLALLELSGADFNVVLAARIGWPGDLALLEVHSGGSG
jgi:hypothetical protein